MGFEAASPPPGRRIIASEVFQTRTTRRRVEVEFSTSTSTRPAAAAPAGAANNPADAHRGALGRASPSAPLALDPRSSQMLDELFATATELERSLTARGEERGGDARPGAGPGGGWPGSRRCPGGDAVGSAVRFITSRWADCLGATT